MNRAAAAAASVLEQAQAGPEQVERVLRELRAAASQVVRAVYDGVDEQAVKRVQELVLEVSKEQLLRDRSWMLMQGWEPDPSAVPRIQDLLQST
jgi:hypothetical protein